jgi:7-cyano-7-deazaguanine synthase in queuosine biosynthesis
VAKDLAIVLNNGSINSAVAAALAAQKYRLVFLHAEVAQQPGSRVRAAYDQQVAHFKPFREHTLPMPWLTAMQPTGRAATAAATQTHTDPRMHAPMGPQLVDLLPLVAAAARFAAHYSAAAIFLGLRVGPHGDGLAQATEYVQVWNELLQMPCSQPELEVQAPLLELEPWQVVDLGFQVAAPFERTWSCTEDGSEACWACRGCRGREAAFQQAGKPDPLRAVKGRS